MIGLMLSSTSVNFDLDYKPKLSVFRWVNRNVPVRIDLWISRGDAV